MPTHRPEQEEGVVLSDVAEVVKAAEEKNGVWPGLEEPTFSEVSREHSNFAERVTLWTMVGVLGAVTIYGIATRDYRVIVAVLAIASGTLLRLTGLTPDKRRPGEKQNDPRAKGPPKKGRG